MPANIYLSCSKCNRYNYINLLLAARSKERTAKCPICGNILWFEARDPNNPPLTEDGIYTEDNDGE